MQNSKVATYATIKVQAVNSNGSSEPFNIAAWDNTPVEPEMVLQVIPHSKPAKDGQPTVKVINTSGGISVIHRKAWLAEKLAGFVSPDQLVRVRVVQERKLEDHPLDTFNGGIK